MINKKVRLIDADELKKAIKNYYLSCALDNEVYDIIDNAPTIESEPYFEKAEKDKRIYEQGFKDGQNTRLQGEWILHFDKYFCTNCGCIVKDKTMYCPNCGANMRGEKNDK